MSDVPGGVPPPPPPPPSSYPPPPGSAYPPPSYPPPPAGGYEQHGYGWTEGGPPAVYAGFWIRFLASLIDGLILGVPVALIAFAIDPDTFFLNVGPGGVNPTATLLVNVLSTIAGLLYYGVLEGGPTGQTLGKRACSIRVVDAETFRPGIGYGRGVGRTLGEYISGFALAIGYLWMLWDPKKQTWHDKMVRTVVVRT